jgi:hypothetical protein
MPMLRVDDEVIAEIDQATADGLLGAASFGIGRVPRPAAFQDNVETDIAPAAAPSFFIQLTVEFPTSR